MRSLNRNTHIDSHTLTPHTHSHTSAYATCLLSLSQSISVTLYLSVSASFSLSLRLPLICICTFCTVDWEGASLLHLWGHLRNIPVHTEAGWCWAAHGTCMDYTTQEGGDRWFWKTGEWVRQRGNEWTNDQACCLVRDWGNWWSECKIGRVKSLGKWSAISKFPIRRLECVWGTCLCVYR